MLVFPNCKINLGLIIKGKRDDGYHDIETVFYPVQLNDVLEIIHSTEIGREGATVFTQSGAPIGVEDKDNLCIKAWHLLKKDYPQLPAVKIHLHKAIPMGAGLGGGSADAAFTLMTLNEKYALNLPVEQLLSYALQLGSDCPFFIINRPCFARGRGEIMEPINVELSGYRLLLVNPGIHINTQWAFSQLNIPVGKSATQNAMHKLHDTVTSQHIKHWKELLNNQFEKPVFKKYPEIKAIKENFYEKGALFASMSGSGSTVYGIFNDGPHAFNFPENYIMRSILL